MEGNGDKGEVKVRQCPFMGEYCIKERCALYIEMKKVSGGLVQSFGMCSFNAMVQMMSEVNNKTQVLQQQKIQVPGILRG